jgi:hypothetical protein
MCVRAAAPPAKESASLSGNRRGAHSPSPDRALPRCRWRSTPEQVAVPGSGPEYSLSGDREWSISSFDALDPTFIHLSQNLAQGWGGTGYGDSSGPTFIDTASGPVQISTVSTGDVPLYATSVNTRLDTQEAHDFIAPYLALG